MSESFTFTKDGIRKVVKATREALRAPKTEPADPSGAVPRQTSWVMLTTSSLTPMAGKKPGMGTGTLQSFDGTTFADMGLSFPIFNVTSATINTGSYVFVGVAYGAFWYLTTSCGNGS